MRKIFMILAIAATVASCYKSDLTDATCSSGSEIEVDIELPTLPDDATIPSNYTISFDGEEITTNDDDTVTLPTDLEAGEYYVYVYTTSEGVSMANNSTSGGTGTIIAAAAIESNLVTSLDDHLYFGLEKVTITPNSVTTTEVSLSQISCDISFNYYIAEGDPTTITSLSATLSGIAQQWECISDTPWGEATTIAPQFAVGESLTKSDNDHIVGSIRVLGTHGSEQLLTIKLTLSDGSIQTEVFDLSDDLEDTNSNKSTAQLVSGEVKLSNAGSSSINGSEVSDWDQVDGGGGVIN